LADLEVRPASIGDAPGAEPLLADALGRLVTLRGGTALLELLGVPKDIDPASLATALCGDALLGTSTLVASLDDAVVGIAVVLRSSEGGVELVGVHTARSLRRRRIGTTLLDAARSLAEAAGDRFEALALPGDQTVKSLLEAAGFRARLLRMSADR
jgi:GNAT superfamily N-acetyltransferase